MPCLERLGLAVRCALTLVPLGTAAPLSLSESSRTWLTHLGQSGSEGDHHFIGGGSHDRSNVTRYFYCPRASRLPGREALVGAASGPLAVATPAIPRHALMLSRESWESVKGPGLEPGMSHGQHLSP